MNKDKYNILVTGASGFIGKSLIIKLISKGYNVIGLVRNKSTIRKYKLYREIIIEDISGDLSEVYENKIDIIIHLAAITHSYSKNYDDYLNTNVDGTKNIINLGIRTKAKLIIMLSSIKVNGEGFSRNDKKYSENCIPKPLDFYGKSKLASEKILIKKCKDNNISYVILRPTIIYGKGVKGNLFNLMKYINRGVPLPIINSNNIRSMLSLNNLIEAIYLLINNHNAYNETYLISDNTNVNTMQLYYTISKNFNKKLYTFKINKSLLKTLLWSLGKSNLIDKISYSLIVDNTKIKTALNWSPNISFEQEINNMVKGYLKTNDK